MRFAWCILAGLLLPLGCALADSPPATKGTSGEVIGADGNAVRVALQNDAVTIETKYGKLVIPAADIERIEFAFHLSDDVAKKIEAAIKRIGDDNFREREAASKELVGLGTQAYPALKLATTNSDAEIARRAELLLSELRGKVPARGLYFPKQDRIQTADCTVSGRITSELKLIPTSGPGTPLKLADLRVFLPGSTGGPPGERGIEVGKVAPEIEGMDIDDKPIKLSSYTGNVVLLFFWGNWCPPCRVMYTQLNSFVTKNADAPFVLLGVNSDKERAATKKAIADEKINWRSFWNSGSTSGPISKDWKITGWPTLVLIDHRGVIRHKWAGSPGDDKLNEAIKALVKEAEGKK